MEFNWEDYRNTLMGMSARLGYFILYREGRTNEKRWQYNPRSNQVTSWEHLEFINL